MSATPSEAPKATPKGEPLTTEEVNGLREFHKRGRSFIRHGEPPGEFELRVLATIDSLRSTLARLSEPSLKVVDAAVEAGDYALKDCDVAKMMEAPGLTAFGVSLAAGVLSRAVTPMLQAAIKAAASESEE